jgi:hypothetical protein
MEQADRPAVEAARVADLWGVGVNAALLKSERDTWNTPQLIVDIVRQVGGGRIALDPCGNAGSIVGADREYRLENGDDGLRDPWTVGGLVYVNPPYGREIGPWVERCYDQARLGAPVIALLPARPDTRWFRSCWKAAAICFIRGRLTFLGAPSPAPFPSVLVYWGTWTDDFHEACADLGHVVRP